jgi:hypothetical protein
MENNKNKLDNSSAHRQKSDMTGGGTPSRLAANVTSHGIVCSALLGSVVLFPAYFAGIAIVFLSIYLAYRTWNRPNDLIISAVIISLCSLTLNLSMMLARIL